jgi:hypothetical protein
MWNSTSSAWSSASEPAEGSDPAQVRILRQPFLDRAIGGSLPPPAQSVSRAPRLLLPQRACVSGGLERNRTRSVDGGGSALPCSALLLPSFCLLAPLGIHLHGVFIFRTPLALPLSSAAFSFSSLPPFRFTSVELELVVCASLARK